MDQTTPLTQQCHNCKTVVTDKLDQDGNPITVWVCEKCGEENHVATVDEQAAQAAIDAAAAVTPPSVTTEQVTPAPPVVSQ